MNSAPAWLQQHLIAEGHVTETGLTRNPKPRNCRRCGQRLLAAIDRNGFDALTWADPTTPAGELGAILTGRQTWQVNVYGGMSPRMHYAIAANSADRVAVHVEHRCGDPPPPAKPKPPPQQWTDPDAPPPY